MKYIIITIVAVLLAGCGPSMSIHDAARVGDIEIVKKFLADGVDVNGKDNRRRGTPLHTAAQNGLKEIAELLIAEGVDDKSYKHLKQPTILQE